MSIGAFADRIVNDLLPTFCDDPHRAARGYGVAGFRSNFAAVHERDAGNFLRAMDAGLITLVSRAEGPALHEAPRSRAGEQFFWTGDKTVVPRPLTLWLEPVITVATLAVLHLDLGWPRHLLGTQSADWAFDVAAYPDAASNDERIACEVKKTVAETDRLVAAMRRLGALPPDDAHGATDKNAYRKVKGLRARRAPFFWAVGPGGHDAAFRLTYPEDGSIDFEEMPTAALRYPLPDTSPESPGRVGALPGSHSPGRTA